MSISVLCLRDGDIQCCRFQICLFLLFLRKSLNLVILRAAMIYGPSSTGTLAKYLAIAYIHKCSNKEMKLLGSGDDKKNTVHSMDVVIWDGRSFFRFSSGLLK